MRTWLCLDCGKVYGGDYIREGTYSATCPDLDCEGYLIELDELMLYPIKELNRKGYMTRFCCSGHMMKSNMSGYILFNSDLFRNNIIIDINTFSPPEGWTLEKKDYTIRYKIDKELNPIERFKTISEHIYSLMKWVDELEPLEY